MPPKKSAKSTTVPPTKCDLCASAIVDGKDEALQCEGTCQKWFHRYCVGVSLSHFTRLANCAQPFVCASCSQEVQQAVVCQLQAEIAALKAEVRELRAVVEEHARDDTISGDKQGTTSPIAAEVQQLKATVNKVLQKHEQNESSSGTWSEVVQRKRQQLPGEQAAAHSATEPGKPSTTGSKQASPYSSRKYNLVLYGVPECPPGTPRPDRLDSDLTSSVSVFSAVDPKFESQSIKDCSRLGKFDPKHSRPRPILVQFVRMADVTKVLVNRGKLNHPYYIKPDMTQEQRQVESVLMRIRWQLIQSGTPRQKVQIRNNRIYVDSKLHGKVVNFEFQPMVATSNTRVQPPADTIPLDPIPQPHAQLPTLPSAATPLSSTMDSALTCNQSTMPSTDTHSSLLSVASNVDTPGLTSAIPPDQASAGHHSD